MKSHRYVLALAAPLLALQACAYQHSGGISAQMTRTEVAIQQADGKNTNGNSPPQLTEAKEKLMQAKVELEAGSAGGDRRAMRLAKKAEDEAQYASAHPEAAAPQDLGTVTPMPYPAPSTSSAPLQATPPIPQN